MLIHFPPLKSGQPLYSGQICWSQCALYREVPLYFILRLHSLHCVCVHAYVRAQTDCEYRFLFTCANVLTHYRCTQSTHGVQFCCLFVCLFVCFLIHSSNKNYSTPASNISIIHIVCMYVFMSCFYEQDQIHKYSACH